MEENKIMMVRSSKELVERGLIGYGWMKVDFSQYKTADELIEEGFVANGYDFGRSKNQIKRYFNLKKGDIVVVPLVGTVAIGIVSGEKKFDKNSKRPNLVKVDFYKNKDGNKNIYTPRSELETNLQQRLKIKISIADLGKDFRYEIEKVIRQIENGEAYTWNSVFADKEEHAKSDFITALEERLCSEKDLGIKAGGTGLELLICEIFTNKGYDTSIPAKNSRSKDEGDVDIIAYKEGEFGTVGEKYLIQAKHHRGETGVTGIDQLITWKDEEECDCIYKKILITTASKVNGEAGEKAAENKIKIITGKVFSEFIHENIDLLSPATKAMLGISTQPVLL